MNSVTWAAVLAWTASWMAFGLASGWVANRWSAASCARDGWLTRLRPWEDDGRWWEHTGVRRWKSLLPEAGDFYEGGMSKRCLPGRSPELLGRFAAETRRAERVHWLNAAWGTSFVVWAPATIALAMIAFGVVVHAPFIIVQRYNRGRVLRTLRRANAALAAGERAGAAGLVIAPGAY